MVEATFEDLDIPSVLRGNQTKEDGGAVLSTTWPKDQRLGAGTGTEDVVRGWVLTGAVQRRREGR